MAIPTAACNQIIGYLDELLNPTAYDDYGPNGLQVPGSEEIQTVVTGVSVARMRRRADMNTSCVMSSARPWSWTIP